MIKSTKKEYRELRNENRYSKADNNFLNAES